MKSDLKNELNEAGLEQLSHTLGQKIGESAAKIISTTTDLTDAGDLYIKENPKKSVAIAAAAGLVLGAVLTLILRRPRAPGER